MPQGSKLGAWIGGFVTGLVAWLVYLGTTFGAVALQESAGWEIGRFDAVFNAWPLWLGVPSVGYLVWRARRGKGRLGFAVFGLGCSLALPMLALLVFVLFVGVSHA